MALPMAALPPLLPLLLLFLQPLPTAMPPLLPMASPLQPLPTAMQPLQSHHRLHLLAEQLSRCLWLCRSHVGTTSGTNIGIEVG